MTHVACARGNTLEAMRVMRTANLAHADVRANIGYAGICGRAQSQAGLSRSEGDHDDASNIVPGALVAPSFGKNIPLSRALIVQ